MKQYGTREVVYVSEGRIEIMEVGEYPQPRTPTPNELEDITEDKNRRLWEFV